MHPITTPALPSAETTELTALEGEAQALSSRRRGIHAQIDQLYLAVPLTGDQIARLDRLEEEERTISSRRRALHRDIDERRWRLGLPAGPGSSGRGISA